MTDTPNGNWPDPNAPGVPANPERNGAHVIHWYGDDETWLWFARRKWWVTPNGRFLSDLETGLAYGCRYLGAMLTPAEVAAREAAAWCAGRDAAAADADCGCDEREAVLAATNKVERHRACSREPCCAMEAQSIRELAPPADLSAALAAREAAAKADGMREAAGIADSVRKADDGGLVDGPTQDTIAAAILARVAESKP